MQEKGVKKFETDTLTLTVKESYTRDTVDSAKLKASYPEVYAECKKTSTVKESLTIKIK